MSQFFTNTSGMFGQQQTQQGFDISGRFNVPLGGGATTRENQFFTTQAQEQRDLEIRQFMSQGLIGSTIRSGFQGLTNNSILGG